MKEDSVYLTNLNEDPLLNMTINYDLQSQPMIKVTRSNNLDWSENWQSTIILNGINIYTDHAIFENKENVITLKFSYIEP